MESYCAKCKKYTKNINPRVLGTSNDKAMTLSQCAMCGSKKNQDLLKIKKQKVLEPISLGHRTPLSKVPLLGEMFFWGQFHWSFH